MVVFSYLLFQQKAVLNAYPINSLDLLLACGISALGGLLMGGLGWKLAARAG
jgi:hypothetical protein